VALSLLVGELLGYARVSTTVQDPALQHDALSAAGCWRTWTGCHRPGSVSGEADEGGDPGDQAVDREGAKPRFTDEVGVVSASE